MSTPLRERIGDAAKPYLSEGWRYGHANRVAYPWPAGVRGPSVARVAADREIDCVGLSASVVMRAYQDVQWTQDAYAGLLLTRRPVVADDPIRTVAAVGVGARVDAFVAEAWHLVQGVRSFDPFNGHAIIIFDRGNGTLDVLESTSRENRKGPRWRTTTEAALRIEFPGALYIARLRE